MSPSIAIDKQTKIWLACILMLAVALRLFHLDYQGLWLDELFTATQISPKASWEELMNYLRTDPHPPLYYIVVKLFGFILGNTPFIIRLPSVIAGTISVWAMFLLGREILNNRTGLIAAAITTVNFYALQYSQEARDYIFAFLFAILSFLYLVRFLKTKSLMHSICYGIYTLMLLYSHYYGIFIAFSQAFIIVLFFIISKSDRRKYATNIAIGGSIVILGYLPWLPFLFSAYQIEKFWLLPPANSFLIDYFFEYFGDTILLKPLLVILLSLYAYQVYKAGYNRNQPLQEQPLLFSSIILSIWILLTLSIPYVHSIVSLPMLWPRYTIVILPAYLIAISIGIALIKNKTIQLSALSLFMVLSITDIVIVKRYYTSDIKEQHRELIHFIATRNRNNAPIVQSKHSQLYTYYFEREHVVPNFITSAKNTVIDSILQLANTPKAVESIWMVDSREMEDLVPTMRKGLYDTYIKAAGRTYIRAWAELFYLYKTQDSNITFIIADNFPKHLTYKSEVTIWGDEVVQMTQPIPMKRGLYEITLSMRGTEVSGAYARVMLFANKQPLGTYTTTAEPDIVTDTIYISQELPLLFDITITNPMQDPENQKARNAFIKFIRLRKIKQP